MSEDIIEFYKQANNAKSVEEPSTIEQVSEQATVVVEAVEEPTDPFARFLLTLNKNLKEKQDLIKQQTVTETVEPVEEPVKVEKVEAVSVVEATEEDPFNNFIDRLQTIVKSKKEQNIKDAAIGFITELKEKPEDERKKELQSIIDNDVKEIEVQKEEPVVQPVELEEKKPVEVKTTVKAEDSEQPYVKELKAIGEEKKGPKKVTKQNDIKTLITQQVELQTSKMLDDVKAYAKRILDLGGGGGSVAQQFANGGTMNGSLNVTGKYLSAGVDLSSIFSGGGGGYGDRLIAGPSSLILNSDGTLQFPNNIIRSTDDTEIILESENASLSAYTQVALTPHGFIAYDNGGDSISFDSVSNTIVFKTADNYTWTLDDQGNITGPSNTLNVSGSINTSGNILSGGRNLDQIFITHETDSQTLTYNPSSYNLSISNGNTVSLASLSSVPVDLSFLSVSGNWNSAYASTTALNLSSNFWNTAYTNLVSNSSAYLSGYDLSFLSVSGNWNSTYTTVGGNSGNWSSAYNVSTAYQSASSSFIQNVNGTANQINASTNGSTVTLSLPSSAIFPGDVSIIGNLSIAGSATYINTDNLIVGDNLIYLNNDNYGSNVLDTGFVSHFTQAPLGYNHTGLVRRAGQGIPGVWTLFSGLTTEPASASNIDWNDKNLVVDSLSANLIGNVTGNADTVTNGVYTNQSYSDPSWITSLADSKITGTKFATNTNVSTLTSQLVKNTDFSSYQTSVASSTATLLPTSVYQNASSSFVQYTAINSVSGNWNTAYQSLSTNPHILNQSLSSTTTLIGSNTANNTFSEVLGGQCNLASGTYSTIVNGFSSCATGYATFVGAGSGVCATGNYAVAVGGNKNTASGNYSTVAGGSSNTASACATVGGGLANNACGARSVISGGSNNNIASNAIAAVIAGGRSHTASGNYSTVVGGQCNTASGVYSSITGGFKNTNSGRYSFIAAGSGNDTKGFANTFILGTGLSANQANFTYVNNLSSQGLVYDATNNSSQWNNTYTSYSTNSGTFLTQASAASLYSKLSSQAFTLSGSSIVPLTGSNIVSGNYNSILGGQNNNIVAPVIYQLSAYNAGSSNFNGVYTYSNPSLYTGPTWGLYYTGGSNGVWYFGSGGAQAYQSSLSGLSGITGPYINISASNPPPTVNILSYQSSVNNTIVGGSNNTLCIPTNNSVNSFIGGGSNNIISANNSFIGGGNKNTASGCYSTIVNGNSGSVAAPYSFVGSGVCNTASGVYSLVGTGICNTASGRYNTLIGGRFNYNPSFNSDIHGGAFNHTGGCIPSNLTTAASISGNGSRTALIQTGIGSCFSNSGTQNAVTLVWMTSGTANSSLSSACFTTANICTNAANCIIINGDYSTCTSSGLSACNIWVYDRCVNLIGCNNFIGGGVLNTNSGCYGTIGGGFRNFVGNSPHITIGGGLCNCASNCLNTIGGGSSNGILSNYSTIAGGISNKICSGTYATIGGGINNLILNVSCNSTIAGGNGNIITCAIAASILGGISNTASGIYSSITGGYKNTNSGRYSFIAAGSGNDTKGFANTFILGTGLSATQINTTYVNNLSAQGIVYSNPPVFSGYGTKAITFPTSVWTKVVIDTTETDTNNNFNTTLNTGFSGRFTPTIAGYYQLNGSIQLSVGAPATSSVIFAIYKNGAEFKRGSRMPLNTAGVGLTISQIVSANGSTDYFELYLNQGSSSTVTNENSGPTVGPQFNGTFVRSL